MNPEEQSTEPVAVTNPFVGADVERIVREHLWLTGEISPEQSAWCERAASFLGSHAVDCVALAELLGLIFQFDAQEVLLRVESHIVLSRVGAREVLRRLALFLLDGEPLTSARFSEIISQMKESIEIRGRDLFHTVRLALAGRAGGGELDRVILLIDEAAGLGFAVAVKTTRGRILDFCGALD
jgi:glutamyl-tRNA synthetase/nondiscriminating glutamyl-tRNA synthetase